jgi:catechol 2,3-dioxygenase-like lactoylglutathione lyase family enzyme
MLDSTPPVATVAVSDITTATQFYQGTLGFSLADSRDGVRSFTSGGSQLLVYESEFAGTNKATAVTFVVGSELAGIVRTLRAKGVVFEHYAMPNTRLDGDIHISGDMQVAWFKDPDSNIICLVSG